jgi:hypothetical protein
VTDEGMSQEEYDRWTTELHDAAKARLDGQLDKINEASARNRARQLAEADAAAASDGFAQAVCRALRDHIAHSGAIPWPSIKRPYAEWAEAQVAHLLEDADG